MFYANISQDLSGLDESEKARKEVRRLASQLRASQFLIPHYGFLSRLRIVPRREAIKQASASLIGFSNSLGKSGSAEHRDAVAKALNIDWAS